MAALVLSFVERATVASAITGAAGAISLIFMKSRVEERILQQGQGAIQVSYEPGYTLALLLLIAGAAWSTFLFWQKRQQPGISLPPPAPQSPGVPGHGPSPPA